MNDEFSPVLCERDGAIAVVRLNRPEKRNAMNRALSARLAEIFDELDADESVLAIVLTGAGDRAFSAGADMNERMASFDSAEGSQSPAVDGVAAVARCRKPVIAAINGFAYGGGARLAITADIRLASSTARIRFVGASYGLVVGGTLLPWLVGPAVAKELLFTARIVEAEEAQRIGLVNHVYPPEQLMDEAIAMARLIASNSPPAVQWSKRVVDASTVIVEGLEAEVQANQATRHSEDHSSRFREATERLVGGR